MNILGTSEFVVKRTKGGFYLEPKDEFNKIIFALSEQGKNNYLTLPVPGLSKNQTRFELSFPRQDEEGNPMEPDEIKACIVGKKLIWTLVQTAYDPRHKLFGTSEYIKTAQEDSFPIQEGDRVFVEPNKVLVLSQAWVDLGVKLSAKIVPVDTLPKVNTLDGKDLHTEFTGTVFSDASKHLSDVEFCEKSIPEKHEAPKRHLEIVSTVFRHYYGVFDGTYIFLTQESASLESGRKDRIRHYSYLFITPEADPEKIKEHLRTTPPLPKIL